MNKKMSLITKELLINGLYGIMWIMVGVMQIFKVGGSLGIITASILVVVSVFGFVPYFIKTDIEDEMAELNKKKSKSTIYDIMIFVIIVCAIISLFKDEWIVNLNLIIPFLVGIPFLLEFIIFALNEKMGD